MNAQNDDSRKTWLKTIAVVALVAAVIVIAALVINANIDVAALMMKLHGA